MRVSVGEIASYGKNLMTIERVIMHPFYTEVTF